MDLARLDAEDPLRGFRDRFSIPEGMIYLAGNSLGPPPKAVFARLKAAAEQEWGTSLVHGWTDDDWIGAPARVGDKIGRLVGAKAGEVVVADSTSVDLFKLMAAALAATPGRRKLLGVQGEFPTDIYVAEGVVRLMGGSRLLEQVERGALLDAIDEDTALVVLTHGHYRTAELFDLGEVTARAHAKGAMVLWDLSHSAGVAEIDLSGAGADLAVGCGYKYLNGGPGAPAWLYVAERHQGRLASPLSGWMGHARPFDFADAYAPAHGIGRFLCGTPPILSLLALEVGIDVMLEVDARQAAAKARRLGDVFLDLTAEHCPGLQPICPGPGRMRGGHVAFRHPRSADLIALLAAEGVIGDVRGDILRFGLSPLYVGFEDVGRAVQAMARLL